MAIVYKALPHQVYGTQKIIDNVGILPAIDMGLGKTVLTLTAIIELKKRREVRKVLVIAPLKVAETVWTDEIEKWQHCNHLTVSKILGDAKTRQRALAAKTDVYLINRENVSWLVAYYGSNWPFDMVIVDESSSFKNPKSNRFKSLQLVLRFIKRTVCLTGTPVPNGMLDLWTQIFILDQGQRLGKSYANFRDTYFNPGKREGHTVFSYTIKEGSKLLGDEFYSLEIMDRVKDICFSMKTEDYIKLPEKIDNDCYVNLSKEQMKQYKKFEREQVLALADKDITALNAAGLFNKLCQFANGTIYDADKVSHVVHDGKFDRLKEIVEDLNGKPMLVFYSIVADKERILSTFKQARHLKTAKDIKDWNEGKIEILVAHPASAGHGLNLQFGGNNILWYGMPTSLEFYLQGIKRIHRNGVVGIVNNMRLITRGTQDERVIQMLAGKDKLQTAMIRAVKAMINDYRKAA